VALERQGLGSVYAANPQAAVHTIGPGPEAWSSFWKTSVLELAESHRVLVFDSLTRAHSRNLDTVSAKRIGGRSADAAGAARAAAHEKVIFANKLDLTEQDYGRAHRWTNRQLEILEDLPCHVIAVAHCRLTRAGSGLKASPYIGAQKINDSFHLHRRFSGVGFLHHCRKSGKRTCRWTSRELSISGKQVQVGGKEHAFLPEAGPPEATTWLHKFDNMIERLEKT